jgi:rhodanese-related sulfurtransferase
LKKFFSTYLFPLLLALLVYQTFFRNVAEAEAKPAYDLLLAGKAVFIDVREESEVKEGMIKGALWIPLSKIEENKSAEVEKIKNLGKNKQVFLYCRSGNRSGKVKSYLQDAGQLSVNLGGYSSLVDEKIPTQSGPQ